MQNATHTNKYVVHRGFVCDGCNGVIKGTLWHCKDCGDSPSTSYDLCQTCKESDIFATHLNEIAFEDLTQSPQFENHVTMHSLVPVSTPQYLLHEASFNGNLEAAESLLRLPDAKINMRWQGSSPLCKGVDAGHESIVSSLLRHPDIDPNLVTVEGGRTPLDIAFENEDESMALLLLSHPDIEVDCSPGYLSVLHQAAKLGFLSAFDAILSHGADPSRKDSNGVSVLHAACCSTGNVIIVDRLMNYKEVSINAQDCDGNTPLSWAVHGEQARIVGLLLTKGADPSIVNFNQSSPLHAAVCNGHERIAKLLLTYLNSYDKGNKKSVLYASDKFGHSAIYYAVTYENETLVRALLEAGHDVNHKEADQDGLLHIAVRSQDLPMIRLLLEYGADPNVLNAQLNTPLHFATQYVLRGNVFNKILELLLDYGVDVDVRGFSNYRSSTTEGALNMAIGSHKISFAALLVKYGCNVDVKTSYFPFLGRTSFGAIEESAFEQAWRLDERNLCLLLYSAGSKLTFSASESPSTLHCSSSWGWFNANTSRPRRLVDLARLRVRAALIDLRAETLTRLFLPKRIRDFLLFDDFQGLWMDDCRD